MMSNMERLAYMADQIARNFETQDADTAVHATAEHIRSFWDPRMKERMFAALDGSGADPAPALGPVARAAFALLREQRRPPPEQARAPGAG